MRYKKSFIFICLLVCLFSIASVCASDVNETTVASENQSEDVILSVEDTYLNDSLEMNDENNKLGDGAFYDDYQRLIYEFYMNKPGITYNLSRDYTYSKGNNSGITIFKPITIDGKSYSISGASKSRILNITADNVVLKNIIFKNGVHEDFGGAIYWSGNNGTLINCSFDNCGANHYFSNNRRIGGGAIYWPGKQGTLINCSFNSCDVTKLGYTSDDTTSFNLVGGALYFHGRDYSVINCSFKTCYCYAGTHSYGYGGAIYSHGFNTIVVNCSFSNCRINGEYSGTRGYGGAISGSPKINYCTFIDCTSGHGGAMNIADVNNADISNSIFKSNVAENGGGAIYGTGVSSLSIVNCSFEENSAKSGGGIFFTSSVLRWGDISNCSFIKNNAVENGGAAYCRNLYITDCTFVNNSASKYYDLDNGASTEGKYYIKNSVFSNKLQYSIKDSNKCLWDSKFNNVLYGRDLGLNMTIEQVGKYFVVYIMTNTTLSSPLETTLSTYSIESMSPDYFTGGVYGNFNLKGGKYLYNSTLDYCNEYRYCCFTAKVTSGSSLYRDAEQSVFFKNNPPELKIFSQNITYHSDDLISFSIEPNINTTLKLYLYEKDERRYGFSVNIINGYGNVSLSDCMPSNYLANVIFEGNNNLTPVKKDFDLTIYKFKPEIIINASNIKVGEDAKIKIEVPCFNKLQYSNLAAFINDKEYSVELYRGYGNLNIKGLPAGDQNITVVFYENNYYDYSISKASFNVLLDISSNLNLTFSNYTCDECFNIEFPNDASGKLILTIMNSDYIFNITEGTGSIILSNLDSGNHYYNLTYTGDNKYSGFSKSGVLNIKLNIKDMDVPVVSNTDQLSIKLPSDATGTVTLNIGGKNYNFNVVNGVANVKVPDLANGVYSYSITYSGDGKYSSFTKTGKVTINKPAPKPVTKTTLTLKKVKVKRSAKKLVIQATLKINGKAVKGKTIKFKFNKKTYKARTNAKGVAKITVKKSVLKKLKAGKKVKYQATYGKLTKKITVKVKK